MSQLRRWVGRGAGVPLWHLGVAFLGGVVYSLWTSFFAGGLTWEPWAILQSGLYAAGGYVVVRWLWRTLSGNQLAWLVVLVALGWLFMTNDAAAPLVFWGGVLWLFWWFRRGRAPSWNVYTSKWAEPKDLGAYLQPQTLDATAVLFAATQAGLLGVRPGSGGRREYGHVLFCGPTRSGKSVALNANLAQWGGSAVLLDIKGELYRQTAGVRSQRGEVFLLSTEGKGLGGVQYDPIKQLAYSDEGLRTAAEIILHSEQDREPVFAQRASLLLHAAFLGAQQQGQAGVVYLDALTALGHAGMVRYLDALDNRKITKLLTQYLGFPPDEASSRRLADDRFLSSSFPTLLTRVAPVTSSGVKTMLGKDRLDPLVLMKKPCTLYLSVPESELLALAPALKLVVASLMTALTRAYDNGAALPVPLLWGLDEAGRVRVPKLPDYLSTLAGRNMSALLFVQDLSQLKEAYGEHGASTVLANCRTQVYHPTDDLTTAKLVSERSGRFDFSDWSVSRSRKLLSHPSDSVKRGDRPLITPDEVMNSLHPDEVIAFTRGTPPIRAWRLMPNTVQVQPLPAPPLKQLKVPRLRVVAPEPVEERERVSQRDVDDLLGGL